MRKQRRERKYEVVIVRVDKTCTLKRRGPIEQGRGKGGGAYRNGGGKRL